MHAVFVPQQAYHKRCTKEAHAHTLCMTLSFSLSLSLFFVPQFRLCLGYQSVSNRFAPKFWRAGWLVARATVARCPGLGPSAGGLGGAAPQNAGDLGGAAPQVAGGLGGGSPQEKKTNPGISSYVV